jgi:hypothetical protein
LSVIRAWVLLEIRGEGPVRGATQYFYRSPTKGHHIRYTSSTAISSKPRPTGVGVIIPSSKPARKSEQENKVTKEGRGWHPKG